MTWFRQPFRLALVRDYLEALVMCHRQAAIIKAQAQQIDRLQRQIEVWEHKPPLWESAILAVRQKIVGDDQ